MKKIIGLSIAALLVIGVVAGGTVAYFSDTETSTGNTFTAGTLNLVDVISGTAVSSSVVETEQADGPAFNDKVVFGSTDPIRPGSSGTITWVLTNSGNLGGTLTIASTSDFSDVDANDSETAVTVPHDNNGGTNGDLDEFVGVRLQRGLGADQAAAIVAFTDVYADATNYKPFSGLEAVLDDAVGQAMAASGGSDTLVYKLSWNIAADIVGAGVDGKFGTADDVAADDNIIQSDTAQIDITFTLTQPS